MPDELPAIARPDAGLTVVGEWLVGTPERQTKAIDAAVELWQRFDWPDGLLSYTIYSATDGATVVHYAQATDPGVFDGFGDTKAQWAAAVNAVVSGIERRGVVTYQPYRSAIPPGARPETGCVVFVSREFESPDLGQARALVDTLFDAPKATNTASAPGMVAAHFHVSLDGSRVLNYAEWASEDAHRNAIENPPAQLEASTEWRRAHAWPGLKTTTFKRCVTWRSAI